MSHATHIHEPCHTYEGRVHQQGMAHVRTSHVTHTYG